MTANIVRICNTIVFIDNNVLIILYDTEIQNQLLRLINF